MKLSIYCDGGSRGNPGPSACAYLVYEVRRDPSTSSGLLASPSGILREKRGKYLGIGTNNRAEYQAIIEALTWLTNYVEDNRPLIREVFFYLDSLLVVNHLKGEFQVKEPGLRSLFASVNDQIKSLRAKHDLEISFSYIPREQNYLADELVNKTLDANFHT